MKVSSGTLYSPADCGQKRTANVGDQRGPPIGDALGLVTGPLLRSRLQLEPHGVPVAAAKDVAGQIRAAGRLQGVGEVAG